MKIEELIELTAWRGELANIAAVILFGIVAAMIQERWPGITCRAIGWLSLVAVCGLAFAAAALHALSLL
jgi:hypothetical protein